MIARLSATLDRVEKKEAVLKVEGGQELRVSIEDVWQPVVGDEYVVSVMPRQEAEIDQQELARILLNQLLRPDDNQQPPQSNQ